MSKVAVKVGAGGRLVIPHKFREALGIKPGDTVILLMEADGLHVLTPAQAISRAQALVRQHVAPGRHLSDELIAERREEVDAA